ncbi:MAG: hypothetical protein ACFFCW_15660, partial [Candidatus Hodarchaeota archaeon]
QHIKSKIEIQLVPGEYFFPAIQDQIKAQLTRVTEDEVIFEFNLVEEIPKDKSGKHRVVVSKVSKI